MRTDREIDEAVARCVAAVVYYRNCGRNVRAREVLEADLVAVAEWIVRAALPVADVARLVLEPVRDALLERYERPQALALYNDFVAAIYPEIPSDVAEVACRA